jgi:hypothetical protein
MVPCFPTRTMFDARMCMWGDSMPKRGQFDFSITSVGKEIFDLLSSEENNVLDC